MAEKVLSSRIIHKHDVAANWIKATNFVPKQGELIVYDIDADHAYERIKIGDGTRNVNALPFVDDALRASLLTEIGAVDDKVDAVSALVGDTAVSEQINAAVDTKMDKENPTGTGAFSLNRKEGTTVGTNSHTEGTNNTASGVNSHAEGDSVVSSGNNSHAEGSATKAIGAASHAEGLNTTASGGNAHAEGSGTQATNINAHAEGQYSKATGQASHAEGFFTNAIGGYSHSEGYYTSANSSHQHVQGKYNVIDSNATYAHVVGNGTSDSARSNAHTLDWDGNAWFQGTVKIGGASQDDETAKELATQEYVDTAIAAIPAPDETLTQSGVSADAKATGDAINEIQTLVGDTTVATQISEAVATITPDSIGALDQDDYYGIIRKEGNIVSSDSLNGLAIGAITTIVATQAGSGTASPDNIRAISGRDSVKLNNSGNNVLPKPTAGTYDTNLGVVVTVADDGTMTFTGTSTGNINISIPLTQELSKYTGMYIHIFNDAICSELVLLARDENGTNVFQVPVTKVNRVDLITAADTNPLTAIGIYIAAGATLNITVKPMIATAEATEYEQYNGTTITAELPETVYGGSLDWDTGVLTVDTHYVALNGSENWWYNSAQFVYSLPQAAAKKTGLCSHYPYKFDGNGVAMYVDGVYLAAGKGIADTFTSVSEWKAYLTAQNAAGTPLQIVYPLATPYTIRLTAQQLKAIDGMNCVWSDCGDTCVTFNYTPFLDVVNNKVDKVDGKGLSTNDYTTAEKDKLAGIEDGANKIVIDNELSSTSTNPVQNKVISTAIDNLTILVGDDSVSNQISSAIANKSDVGHAHTADQVGADPSGSAESALSDAKLYTDTKIADLINSAPTTLDTLGEIATAMEENADVVEALDAAIGTKANAADVVYVSDAITDAEIDAICGATLEFDDLLTDETTGTTYKLYVSDGDLKMTEVTE